MNNIEDTASLNTSSERYCPWGHFDYKNSSIWSFWTKIWAIEGPNHTRFSIFATVKIGFCLKFVSPLWQNYSSDRSEIFCGTRYRSWDFKSVFELCISFKLLNSWKTEDFAFLRKKTRKKWKSHPSSQNFPGPANDPKVTISVLKCSLKC